MTENPKQTTTFDIEIGNIVGNLRRAKGLSREQLATQIGVTHQQMHKYEKAHNRISAGRLYKIAEALETPIAYFFTSEKTYKPNTTKRMQLEIARYIASIDNPKIMKGISDLLRVIEREVK